MPIEFKYATLPNGLTVIAEVDPHAHTAAMGIFVKTGARDEADDLMGVSHFLEHMMFKGTERRSAEDVNRDFDRIGASYNAFTSHEMTAFWAHVLPDYLDPAEDILCDILRPALRQRDFDAEKKVILEEIAMYEDHPFWVLYEKAMERYYASHPLRHRVLGTVESITSLSRDQMLDYFSQRYSSDNMVIALAGALDFDEQVRSIEEKCGHWQATGAEREYPEIVIPHEEFAESSEKFNRHYTLMIAPAPPVQDDDRYAAAILAHILGDSEGSRLYWALVDTGLAEEAQAQFDARDGVGEFYVFASCTPSDAGRVEETAMKEIDSLPASIEQDDLVRVRSRLATTVTLAGERPAGRMRRLGQMWTQAGEYRSLEDEIARINAVTVEELQRVAKKYPLPPRVIGRLHPAGASNG